MSDLDDLANVVRPPQPVSTRRYPTPNSPPQIIVNTVPAAVPRSAFGAGFYGTFGVIAALLVIFLGRQAYLYVESEMEAAREKEAARKADIEIQNEKLQQQQAVEQRAREDAARAAAVQERIQKIAAQLASRREEWRKSVINGAAPVPVDPTVAEKSVSVRGKAFGEKIDVFVFNGADKQLQGVRVLVSVNGAYLTKIDIATIEPHKFHGVTIDTAFGSSATPPSLSFVVDGAFFN